MPIIVLPPGSGTTPAAGYSPLCGSVGVEALRLPAVLHSATTITPRAALAQADIVSGLLPGATLAFKGARITASNAVSSWSDLTTGFTIAWWMDPLAAGNSSVPIFTTWAGIHGINNSGIGERVLLKRQGTSTNFNFEYRSGGAFVAQARTDSAPWDNAAWNHYALTFSATRTLAFYKNGVAIQFDVTTDTGGSTPGNVTSHTYNTPIPVAPRNAGSFFGGSDVLGDDDFGGELFNMGYWNSGLTAPEIAVIAGDAKLDLAVNNGSYVSAADLKINPKFSVLDASGSYCVLPAYGQDSYSIPVGPTVP
jgi:hypothetical protein